MKKARWWLIGIGAAVGLWWLVRQKKGPTVATGQVGAITGGFLG